MNNAETDKDINAVIEAHTRAMAARSRGAEAMKSIANGVFDDATPTELAWRGVWGPRELGSNRNPTMSTTVAFYAPLAHVLARAPKGTTPHLWTSFKSMSAGETCDGDVHAAVDEGYNAWSNALGYQHPKDVKGDSTDVRHHRGGELWHGRWAEERWVGALDVGARGSSTHPTVGSSSPGGIITNRGVGRPGSTPSRTKMRGKR